MDISSRQPNVLLILADDLGYHDLGVTGSTFYETPHLDGLANQGTAFTQAYAGSRVCSPSRASLMLGQFTARHGITDWIGAAAGAKWRDKQRHTTHLPPEYQHVLPAPATTLPEAFRANGYRTFFAGKWHLGGEGSSPEDHGFDQNVGGWDKGSPIGGFFDPYKNPQLTNRQPGENLSIRLARETAGFLRDRQKSPFFAMLSFYAVHAPLQTTQQRWERYRQKAVATDPPATAFAMERRLPIRTEQDHPVYAGLVEQMDQAVGIVLKTLDSLGLADNTIVVFTSDNGGVASGDAYATSNLPLRGGKGYQWEGGIREPLFLKGPGIPVGKTNATPVTGADLLPTLTALAGIRPSLTQELDGVDFSPVFNGSSLATRPLFWHYPHYGNQGGDPSSVIRQGDWKLIHYWEDGHDELYHLSEDPGEQKDLSQQEADRTASMKKTLLGWLQSVNAAYPAPDPELDTAKAEAWAERMRTLKREQLEAERQAMFLPDWEPNADWWGSLLTED